MIIILISGGMGNQLFQLSLHRFLVEMNFANVKVDIGFYKDQNSLLYWVYRKIRKIPKRKFLFEKEFSVQIIDRESLLSVVFGQSLSKVLFKILCLFIPLKNLFFLSQAKLIKESNFVIGDLNLGIVILDGYWQKSVFIQNNIEYIRRLLEDKIKDLAEPNDSVVIHVRRGDQATVSSKNIYTILECSYYLDALLFIKSKGCDIRNITICSDDIEWCKQNLDYLGTHYDVNYSMATSMWDDFKIMYNARYLISSNSTFSFWAGYAGYCDKMIIPKNWYVSNPSNFINDLDKIIEI
jgi:hypothetical protein